MGRDRLEHSYATGQRYPAEPNIPQKPKKRRRIFAWVIVGINLIFLIWLITGLVGAAQQTATQCANQQDMARLCHDASNAGTAIGAALIIGLWVALDIILGILWLVTRKREPQIVYVQQAPPGA